MAALVYYGFRMTSDDVLYDCLPLYHSAGKTAFAVVKKKRSFFCSKTDAKNVQSILMIESASVLL